MPLLPVQIQRYVSKISGPLLDRIDIHIEVPAVQYKELRGNVEIESSACVRSRVIRARELQLERYRGEKKSTPIRKCHPSSSANTAPSPPKARKSWRRQSSASASPPAPTTASLKFHAPL